MAAAPISAVAVSPLVCLAILGRDNSPIFLRSYEGAVASEASIALSLLVHAALDVIESRLSSPSPGVPIDSYQGLLFSREKYRVFGYLTNSKMKILAVTQAIEGTAATASEALKALLKETHGHYLAWLQNPFVDSSPLSISSGVSGSARFAQAVERAARAVK